jgi:endonuclease VIII
VPEGNEIHRFAKLHTATFAGKNICVESPNGRFAGAASLTGRKLKSVIAHGKHLAYDFGRDRKLHIHLGRFGDFTEGKMPFPEVKGVLRMRWSTATDWLELRGATDVSVYSDAQWQAVEERLGADPLAPTPTPGRASPIYARPTRPSPLSSWTKPCSPGSATSIVPNCSTAPGRTRSHGARIFPKKP